MNIAQEPARPKQVALPHINSITQINAPDADPTSIVAFAEKALGYMLEDKQRELLTGPSKRVILNCTRQWGKSWMAAVALLFHAVHNPESLSLVAGPTLRQSAELLKKIKDLALRMGFKSQGDGINRQSLVLPNRSRIVAVPGNSPDGIRGFSGVTMLVIDEASMVKDEIYVAARPMLTQKNGSIWLLSTPREQDGFYYREFTEGTEDWRRVVVPATECPRFKPEQLEAEKASLGARLFAQEFLCEFVSTGDGLFDPAWLEWQEGRVKVAKGLSRWPELRKELLGLDGQGRKKNARDDLALGLALAVWGLTGKGAAAGDRADGRLL